MTAAGRLAIALLLPCLIAASAAAQDVVYLASAGSSSRTNQGSTRFSGKVIDYTGRELVIELIGGRRRTFPGARVQKIESQWTDEHVAGDASFAKGQFRQALTDYQSAIRNEPRRWVQRMILARLVECHSRLNELARAGQLFLTLLKDDPDTPWFSAIPLGWLPVEPDPQLQRKSQEWLTQTDSPAAVLLAASHLAPTTAAPTAFERLRSIGADADPRIRAMAQAQLWRAEAATAGPQQLAQWERQLGGIPEDLRAGPYFVLGRIGAQRGDPLAAALVLLHVPILYPQQQLLAAEGLLAAAQALEKAGRPADGAPALYQELAARYPQTPAADLARQRLNELRLKPAAPAAHLMATGPAEARFLDGLRGRRLFQLAEIACRERLAAPELSQLDRSRLAVELSRTWTEHALHTAPDQREPLWQQAIAALEEPVPQGAPGQALRQVQRGLVDLARGEVAGQEAQVLGAAERTGQARTHLRAAIDHLEQAAETVAHQLRRANQAATQAGGLEPAELASLQDNVRYQLARALRIQGQSYPPRSPDRANSLRQSVELLNMLDESNASSDLSWNARLDEILCLRLLEDFPAAQARLELVSTGHPPPAIELAARAQAIRLALDRGKLEQALGMLDQGRTIGELISPDLDFAWLEAYIAAWRAANQDEAQADKAPQWQSAAADQVRLIDAHHGAYWRRRAETLLAGTVTGSTGADGPLPDAALLVRAAESFYRAGQIDRALAAYDQAVERANSDRLLQQAFDADYAAAAIQQHGGRHAEAATRFRRAALAMPGHAKAADAHLLAIYNTAQAAGQESDGNDAAYVRLLDEHLATWPGGPSASQARLWLGRLRQRRGESDQAIEVLQQVAADHPSYAEAVVLMGEAYTGQLESLEAAGEEIAPRATRAAEQLESMIDPAGKDADQFDRADQAAATAAAGIRLRFLKAQYVQAEALLSRALAGAQDPAPDWKSAAEGLLLVALAGQGRRGEANELVDRLAHGSPRQLLGLLESLSRIRAAAADGARPELAELELSVARRLWPDRAELTAGEQRQFDMAFVRALAQSGRREEALHAAGQLAVRLPKDGEVHEQYASMLLEGTGEESWTAAFQQYSNIQRRSRPGSDRWSRAMYAMALASQRLGKLDQAIGIIKLTYAQHPALDAPMRRQFDDLLARCQP